MEASAPRPPIAHPCASSAARLLRSWWMLDGVRTSPRASSNRHNRSGLPPQLRELSQPLIAHSRSGVPPSLKVLSQALIETLQAKRVAPMLTWLNLGGEINAQDARGRTLLHFASAEGFEAAVSELLRRGADVDVRQKLGITPLAFASMASHDAVLRQLLAAQANTNLPDDRGVTPLMWAARHGSTTTVKLLLKGGAQTALRDAAGLTVMGHAKTHTCSPVAKRIGLILRQHLMVLRSNAKLQEKMRSWEMLGQDLT